MLFHKSGPQVGQPRGYAFVTYKDVSVTNLVWCWVTYIYIVSFSQAPSANRALEKLNGHQVGRKTMVIRLAKNINYVSTVCSWFRALSYVTYILHVSHRMSWKNQKHV